MPAYRFKLINPDTGEKSDFACGADSTDAASRKARIHCGMHGLAVVSRRKVEQPKVYHNCPEEGLIRVKAGSDCNWCGEHIPEIEEDAL